MKSSAKEGVANGSINAPAIRVELNDRAILRFNQFFISSPPLEANHAASNLSTSI
jgi:hypothetical protein